MAFNRGQVPEILKLLDGMAASSLNVLHWHITDTQAWPWNSTSEPLLVGEGPLRALFTVFPGQFRCLSLSFLHSALPFLGLPLPFSDLSLP